MTTCPPNRSSSTCLLEFFAQLLSSSGKSCFLSHNEKHFLSPAYGREKVLQYWKKHRNWLLCAEQSTLQCFTRRWSFPLLFAHDGRSRLTLLALYSRLDSI